MTTLLDSIENGEMRLALAEAREAVEALHINISTRTTGPWGIRIILTNEYMPERSRSGELSYDPELGGYKFCTFLYHGRRTRDLAQVVREVKEELLGA